MSIKTRWCHEEINYKKFVNQDKTDVSELQLGKQNYYNWVLVTLK